MKQPGACSSDRDTGPDRKRQRSSLSQGGDLAIINTESPRVQDAGPADPTAYRLDHQVVSLGSAYLAGRRSNRSRTWRARRSTSTRKAPPPPIPGHRFSAVSGLPRTRCSSRTPSRMEQLRRGEIAAVVFITSKPVDAFVKGKWDAGFKFLPVEFGPNFSDYYVASSLELGTIPT